VGEFTLDASQVGDEKARLSDTNYTPYFGIAFLLVAAVVALRSRK
jgi:hypothetical protein